MLTKTAVRAFFDRDRADWRIYKQLPTSKLDALARKYGVRSEDWAKAYKAQKIMILIGIRTRRFAFWADTGVGKTFVSLVLARYFRDHAGMRRMLIVVKRRANKDEWQAEIEKHAPDLPYAILPSNVAQKWALLQTSDALLFIETYAGLYRMVCDLVRDKKKNKLKPTKFLVGTLTKLIDAAVFDESTEAKNKGKLPFRICNQLSKYAQFVFALSGTPHGRDPSDLWAQMFLVDRGETLGQTLGLFRSAFFSSRLGLFGGMEYAFKKSMQGTLNTVLANRSIRFEADQADLPRLVSITKKVSLPEDAGVYYQRARQTFLKAESAREMKNAFLRMRQISSGFVGYYDDATDTKAKYVFAENPKLDLLLGLIESVGDRHKQIVFYEFTWSALKIGSELQQLGIDYVHLWSGTKDTNALRNAFNNPTGPPVLIMQNEFGYGLNLQVAKYGYFYESPLSPITRKQCRRRVERQNSPHRTVFLYDLVCRRTEDERILKFVEEGEDLLRAIIDGKASRTP